MIYDSGSWQSDYYSLINLKGVHITLDVQLNFYTCHKIQQINFREFWEVLDFKNNLSIVIILN